MIEDQQLWLIIGVIVGAVVICTVMTIVFNTYITARRLATVLSDVEEIIHADFKGLEEKIEAALTKIRIAEAKNRD